ncbi:uncharacterized protein [Physcomitrium patens]|uniref:Uncharacterized protein n=2 Tax=Physcomitrium patens TaxID=3218 RepID=A0A7I4D6Z0_PHYPA|nr:uncharacterized protein LOC112293471 isoform X1 [Physcomitrium patens]|eukprot:XP_024398700.1 uncharacterized protein LOC112293471 isoform X1 [Physcomitrella patens]
MMRHQQAACHENALFNVSRKGSVRNGRKEESADDEKLGDCLKLGNRRVLVRMPGNKLKVTIASQQVKCSNGSSHKVSEVALVRVDEQDRTEEVVELVQKRPVSDGASLPQWGQRKRLRFSNRVDGKAAAETTTADMKVEAKAGSKADIKAGAKAISRTARGAVKAEKSVGVLSARIREPAVASKSSAPKLGAGDSKKDAEGAGDTCVARNVNNHVMVTLECEASTVRIAEVHSDQSLAYPDKVCSVPADSLTAQPALSTKTEDSVHEEKTASPRKVDMSSFQWPKFVISLSRKEKEDDFFAIKGSKIPVRPKKRSKFVEKSLTFISPGAWLCDITRERYEVKEKKPIKKKPRGLKAMGSADSDSD